MQDAIDLVQDEVSMCPDHQAAGVQHPFALWTIYRGMPKWFLAKGCPPTTYSDRWWVRALRVSVLLYSLGALSGLLSALIAFIPLPVLMTISGSSGGSSMDVVLTVNQIVIAVIYACLVLVPLSRWLGRPWWLAFLSLPVSTAAFLAANFSAVKMLESGYPFLFATEAGALILGIWMTPWRRTQFWFLPFTTISLGVVISFGYAPLLKLYTQPVSAAWMQQAMSYISTALAYTLFQANIGVTLGMALWPRHQMGAAACRVSRLCEPFD